MLTNKGQNCTFLVIVCDLHESILNDGPLRFYRCNLTPETQMLLVTAIQFEIGFPSSNGDLILIGLIFILWL